MNPYEAKQEARRERLESAAERAQREAESAFATSHRMLDAIPFGQPILVGHHSEKRHRRDLAKSDAAMRRGIEAQNRAADLARKAASVGTGGVSSDDPTAIEQLSGKVGELRAKRDRMKATNAAFRKGGWEAVAAAGLCKVESIPGLAADMAATPWEKMPFASYDLTNIGARIRDTEQRIAKLTEQHEIAAQVEAGEVEAPKPITGEGFEIVDDIGANRVRIRFAEKPSEDIRARLKSHGFRWAPSEGVWQRQRSNGAMWAAKSVLGVES